MFHNHMNMRIISSTKKLNSLENQLPLHIYELNYNCNDYYMNRR